MLGHIFHTNIIAYCQQNRYVRLAIYTDLFTLISNLAATQFSPLINAKFGLFEFCNKSFQKFR